jgi:hypothetical protein
MEFAIKKQKGSKYNVGMMGNRQKFLAAIA